MFDPVTQQLSQLINISTALPRRHEPTEFHLQPLPNPNSREESHVAAWACVALMTLMWLLTLAVINDYGISWDESVQAEYAEKVWDYFASRGQDLSSIGYLDLKYYGPTVDLIAVAAYRNFPEAKFTVRHLTSAGAGLLTLVPLFLIGRLLGRGSIGILAGCGLLLMPRFVGHAFVNSKDIPFACLVAWSLWAMTNYFVAERRGPHHVALCAICLGLLAGIRPGGWILMTLLLIALYLFAELFQGRRATAAGNSGRQMATMLCGAWGIMVLLWPWAHQNVVSNPIEAMQIAGNFHLEIPVLFEGQTTLSTELPRYYLPKFMAITIPPFQLAFAAFGLVVSVRKQISEPRGREACVLFALQIWLLLPLALYVIKRPNIYDGMRHFLFLLPCVALWAAIGVATVWQWTTGWRSWRAAVILSLVMAGGVTARDIVRLHPYQMTYFNQFVGGLAGAEGDYETEYWLTSYREAICWIADHAAGSADDPIRVLVAANGHSRTCAEFFRSHHMRMDFIDSHGNLGPLPPQYDFYVGTYRLGMSRNFPETPIVKTIGRSGAVFAVIRGEPRNLHSIRSD